MIKLFITAIDSREDGTAVTLFEDFEQTGYENADEIEFSDFLQRNIAQKIRTVEAINEQDSSPL